MTTEQIALSDERLREMLEDVERHAFDASDPRLPVACSTIRSLVTELLALREAVKPFIALIRVNDSDTLSRLLRDEKVVATATGSWSAPASVTLGDFRALARALSHPEPMK